MSGNGYGSYLTTRKQDLQAYDALPRALRDLLKYAAASWAAAAIRNNLAEDFQVLKSRALAIDAVQKKIRHVTSEHCYRTYGPTHPQSDSHGRRLKPDDHRLWAGRR